jgi:methylthioribulose 1-phosphate dehydratase / enolase-phosphatase E1
VLHSHDITCVLVTAITTSNEFRISHQEMIKGIAGYGYHDELIVPIIENTAWESELADSLEQAIRSYPKAYAVLVRDHGIYVWGDNWEQAKRHGECLHYLFNVAIQKHNLKITPVYSHLVTPSVTGAQGGGVGDEEKIDENGDRKRRRSLNNEKISSSSKMQQHDGNSSSDLIYKTCEICCQHQKTTTPLPPPRSAGAGYATAGGYKYLVFDIEGTTTPITFVKDVLFPYARSHVQSYLQQTWTENGTQQDLWNLYQQAQDDLSSKELALPSWLPQMIELFSSSCTSPSPSIPPLNDDLTLLEYLVQYFYWCMDLDRKISALKVIQGKIWRHGYETKQLQSIVYEDVFQFFQRIVTSSAQIKLFIYSSGSMEAQKLLFQYSNCGDLRPYLSCYFDTTIGTKRQAKSYRHIYQSLGANDPAEILFVTDIIEEAYAAKEAGLDAILSNRPGNAPFPANPAFPIITTFDML